MEIFKQHFGVVIHKHDTTQFLSVGFYTLVQGVETILCRSAMKRLTAHEKRIIGLKGGNCLDYAFFASSLFDKLGIKNHIVCVKNKYGNCGFVNIFFDEDKNTWRYFSGLRGYNVDLCFREIKNHDNKIVLEPLKNWDDKYLVDLKTIPLEDFLNQPMGNEIEFKGRLGDFTPSLFFIKIENLTS